MTTSAQVRSAWNTSVWSHSTLTSLTTKIYNYDVTTESTKEYSKFRESQEINFFTYLVSRAQRIRIMNQYEQIFTVDIRYYRKADVAGANYNTVIDAFETIDTRVVAGLTSSWGSTIDFYRIQDGPPAISQIQMEGVPVWLGIYKYFGYKNI